MTVRLNQISKRFGTVEAIHKLNLTFPESGIVAIMGPSGCGKTTLLQILAGLTHPDSGSLQCSAPRIAYVFQEPRLLPWRTVLDNILLVRDKKSPLPERSAIEWLEAVGLGDCATRYPEELSGGMRQRVAIARALYCDSDLLLLDEPFHGLDDANKKHILTLIRQARTGKNKLTVIVTHDRQEATELATTVLTFERAPASHFRSETV